VELLSGRKPRELKAGTKLRGRGRGVYDNSKNNRIIPNPEKTVTWGGDQTSEENDVGFFDVAFRLRWPRGNKKPQKNKYLRHGGGRGEEREEMTRVMLTVPLVVKAGLGYSIDRESKLLLIAEGRNLEFRRQRAYCALAVVFLAV